MKREVPAMNPAVWATIERRGNTTSTTLPVVEMGLSMGHWEHACVAPCELRLDPKYAYRVGGDGLVPTNTFALPRGADAAGTTGHDRNHIGCLTMPHGVRDQIMHPQILSGVPHMSIAPDVLRLTDQLAATWTAFAKTGNPNNTLVPQWQAYDQTKRTTLLLDRMARAAEDPDRELRILVDSTAKG